MKTKKNEWLSEYQYFIAEDSAPVPEGISKNVFVKMKGLLHPSAWKVFFKILVVQLTTGFLSLSICHQFGVNPFNTSRSLETVFMSLGGHPICMVLCGILFVGTGLLAAGFFLTVEEIVALKKTKAQQFLAISLISLGTLAAFGAEIIFSIGLLWLVGAILGSFLATETIWKLKTSMPS